jgi:hypothetical protein
MMITLSRLSFAGNAHRPPRCSSFRTLPVPCAVLSRAAVVFVALLWIVGACAQPLDIALSGAQFTVHVEAQGYPLDTYPRVSRTTVSSAPVSDRIDVLRSDYGIMNHAIASAGLFEVSDQTGWGMANASATSRLWFSPLADTTQTLGVDISISSGHGPFTAGSLSLLDLTANSELWNYNWSYCSPGNIPWSQPVSWWTGSLSFNLQTGFLASHQYELTMQASSSAGDDSQQVSIQLTGLEVVPEPSAACLLAVFGAAFWMARRRR